MRLKKGVDPIALRPEMLLALIVADRVYQKHGQELVITSLNDSRHGPTSLHYAGQAADLRTRVFADVLVPVVAQDIREALGNNPDYDIVVEANHIHMEYQPKRKTYHG